MIEAIQQGLKEDGYEVSIAKLCRWFGVPRRTFYYKPIKKAIPKLQERLVSPIKQLIEENPLPMAIERWQAFLGLIRTQYSVSFNLKVGRLGSVQSALGRVSR